MATPRESNYNLANALKIVKMKKEFQKTFNESPPQTKVILAFIFPLFAGLPVYSFIKDPAKQIFTFSLISLIFGVIFNSFTKSYNEKWAVIMAYLVGIFFWFYIFIKKYRENEHAKKIGKKSFVCSPSGKCQTDGTHGPYNGLEKYVFNPPSSPGEKDNKIPPNQFDIRISDKFTYMFWLKIDYNKWKSKGFYGKDKIVLVKGNDYKNSDLVVWAKPVDDIIQFEVGTKSNKPVSLSVNFPFDKWVHYSIIVNNKVVELYKNATLEQSALLNSTISLRRSPLYLGRTPNNKYNNFPGQLLYLTYNNENLTPSEVYDIYKKEYSMISNMEPSSNIITNKIKGQNTGQCLGSNSEPEQSPDDNDDYDFNSLFESKIPGIQYAENTSIPLPNTKLEDDTLLKKYKKYYK